MELKPATRQGFKPLIGLYGESGVGKTFSALVLARGFVGPKGRIGVIDTEQGRAMQYAPVEGEPPLPMGPYECIQLEQPFSPARYVEAITVLENAPVDIGVIDSISHVWEGAGGVLDMAAAIEDKSGKTGLHCWRQPKFEYALFLLKIMQCKIPIICCLRAKQKSHQVKDQGKTVIKKDEFTSPIASADFIHEMTVYGELGPDHLYHNIKHVIGSLDACLPHDELITLEHGRKIAAWCAAPKAGVKPIAAATSASANATPAASSALRALQVKLWGICKDFRGPDNNWLAVTKQLDVWKIMPRDKTIQQLTEQEISEVIEKVNIQLKEGNE